MDDVVEDPGPSAASAPGGNVSSGDVRSWFGAAGGSWTAVGLAVLWGAVSAWWTPRGPLTNRDAVIVLVVSLALGLACGLLSRTRWTMLITPLIFVAVFEIGRVGYIGPTVDRPHLSTYGLIALIVGRGFHGLVTVFPMVLGGAFGVVIGHRTGESVQPGRRRSRVFAGRTGLALGTVVLMLLAVPLVGGASTAPIVDSTGRPLAGSIAELTTVEHKGRSYGLMLRGVRADAPVLLFLAGGPGGAERGAMRKHLSGLEKHFVVATWDQRGTGASYKELDPTDTLSLSSYVDDTIAVTEFLRSRFQVDRIYVLGQSWGSTLGVLAVQERPELYAAFIGTGQMVSQLATDRIFYSDTLAWARKNGDEALVSRLRSIGEPPYEDILNYETALSHEHEVYPYDHSRNHEGEGGFSENLFVPEYSFVEQVHMLGGFLDTFAVLYPQLQQIDFRDSVHRLEVPAFFVQGRHEAAGRSEPFEEWYRELDAPIKDRVTLDTSGHRPLFEQPEEFVSYMVDTVLDRTRPS